VKLILQGELPSFYKIRIVKRETPPPKRNTNFTEGANNIFAIKTKVS
jgi:hypothetical protein